MTSIYDLFETDPALEADGMWVAYTPDIQFRIRRSNCDESQKVLKQLLAPYKSITRSGRDLPAGISSEVERQWVAQALLVDWRGVAGRDGVALGCTLENRLKMLTELPDLQREIANLAGEAETFRRQQLEDDAKNSAGPSAGGSERKADKPTSSSPSAKGTASPSPAGC